MCMTEDGDEEFDPRLLKSVQVHQQCIKEFAGFRTRYKTSSAFAMLLKPS
jgi:hypothetical protein